jgi:hypothetical protein
LVPTWRAPSARPCLGAAPISPEAAGARVVRLGIANDASFVDVFAGEADIGGGWSIVLFQNVAHPVSLSFPAFLRSIIFVGETPLRVAQRRQVDGD